jgi:hypothetical protein
MRKRRFFFHYHKQKKMWTVHFRGECMLVHIDRLIIGVPCEGKENKRQPYAVMQGFCHRIETEHFNGDECPYLVIS